MTDENTPENENQTPETSKEAEKTAMSSKRKFFASRKGKIVAAALGILVVIGGVKGVQAVKYASGGYEHSERHGGKMSQEHMEKRVDKMTQRLVKKVDATPEQAEKIKTAAMALATEMMSNRDAWRDAGQEMKTLLLSDNVDRTKLETLRQERLAEADQMSKKLVTALADVSEVLNAKQRAELAKQIDKMQSRRGH